MTNKAVHEKETALLARIEEWGKGPVFGVNDSDPVFMQAQTLSFVAEALGLMAAQMASQDERPAR